MILDVQALIVKRVDRFKCFPVSRILFQSSVGNSEAMLLVLPTELKLHIVLTFRNFSNYTL